MIAVTSFILTNLVYGSLLSPSLKKQNEYKYELIKKIKQLSPSRTITAKDRKEVSEKLRDMDANQQDTLRIISNFTFRILLICIFAYLFGFFVLSKPVQEIIWIMFIAGLVLLAQYLVQIAFLILDGYHG